MCGGTFEVGGRVGRDFYSSVELRTTVNEDSVGDRGHPGGVRPAGSSVSTNAQRLRAQHNPTPILQRMARIRRNARSER
jgi:hypothetical protein